MASLTTMARSVYQGGNPQKEPIIGLWSEVDERISGLNTGIYQRLAHVDRATTGNITLSGEQTIDGTLTSASRIGVFSQSAPAQNGIYTTGAGAWTRVADANTTAELYRAAVFVLGGSVNKGNTFYCQIAETAVLGTDPAPFVVVDSSAAVAALQAEIDAEEITRANADIALQVGITNEGAARTSGDSTLANAIVVERARIDTVLANGSSPVVVDLADRPGDVPSVFSPSLNSGDENLLPVLSSARVAVGTEGKAGRMVGGEAIARRGFFTVEAGRPRRIYVALKRTTAPDDPNNDAVRIALAGYDKDRTRLVSTDGTIVLQTVGDLAVDGLTRVFSFVVGREAAPGIDVIIPSTVKYLRAYNQQYGIGAITEVQLLAVEPVQPQSALGNDGRGTLANRSTYNNEDQGFVYVATDQNPWQFFIRQGAAGNWSPANTFTGTLSPSDWALLADYADRAEAAALDAQTTAAGLNLVREILQADRTYYVATTGNDSNNGLTNGTPWLTIQKAIDWIALKLDVNNFRATVQLADGTYTTGQLLRAYVGNVNTDPGAVVAKEPAASFSVPTIRGNPTNPQNVIISLSGGATAFTGVAAQTMRPWFITGLSMTGGANCLACDFACLMYFGNVRFGTVSGNHISAIWGSKIECLRDMGYEIYGSCQAHAAATHSGSAILYQGGGTITVASVSPKPNASLGWFVSNDGANIEYQLASSIVGTSTGIAWRINDGYLKGPIPDTFPYQGKATIAFGDKAGIVASLSRQAMRGPVTFYINKAGASVNPGLDTADRNGLDVTKPWASLQYAFGRLTDFDLAGNTITFQLADGTHDVAAAATAIRSTDSKGQIIIQGNTGNSAAVILKPSSGGLTANGLADIEVRYMTIQSPGGNGLSAAAGGRLTVGAGVVFGACSGRHLSASDGGTIIIQAAYTINGAAAAHWQSVNRGSILSLASYVITITGTPAFSSAFAECQFQSIIKTGGSTFSGSATGPRKTVLGVSALIRGGVTLPGDSAGSIDGTSYEL